MRLPCDNIDDFIRGLKHHYSVTNNRYRKGQAITLYSDYKECDFKVRFILHFPEHHVLHLTKIEGSEHERDVISDYYGMTNPLD